MHRIMASPSTGMNNGWFWFLNALCIIVGPATISGSDQAIYDMPFIKILLSVPIALYCFSYVFMLLQ